MLKTLLILAVFCTVISSSRGSHRQFYCGRRLAETLAALCENVEEKRSQRSSTSPAKSFRLLESGSMARPVESVDYFESSGGVEVSDGQDFAWPFIPRDHARAMASTRGKRQIVSECCMKPCSIEELLEYC